MKRETDFTYPNPPDDMPNGPFQIPWPRKPLSGKPKSTSGPARNPFSHKPSKSGLSKFAKRVTHPDPFF